MTDRTAHYPVMDREALRPLREHRAFLWTFVLSATLTALALTYIYSTHYQATTTFILKPSTVTELNTQTLEALGSNVPVVEAKNVKQSIEDLATSYPVLRRVVTDLHLQVSHRDTSGPWYTHYYLVVKYALKDYGEDAWIILKYGSLIKDDPIQGAAKKLGRLIKIDNENSYVYSIEVSADKPQKAAAESYDLAKVMAEVLHRDNQRSFDQRERELVKLRDRTRREIEDINARMQQLLAGHRVAAVDETLTKLADSQSQLRQEIADTQANLAHGEAKVAAEAAKLRVPMPGIGRAGYAAAAGSVSRLSPADYTVLTTYKLQDEVNNRGQRGELAAYQRSYAALTPRIEELTDVKARYDLLSAKLAAAKTNYNVLSNAIAEVSIRKTASVSELHILGRPAQPVLPKSPIKIYHVGAALGLALLVAAGLAYVLDYFAIGWFLPPPASGRSRHRGLSTGAVAPSSAD